ncbi:MAG: CpaF family protein, partial [Bryobacteraceae bacterium]
MFGKRGTSGASINPSIAPPASAPQPRFSDTSLPASPEPKPAISPPPIKGGGKPIKPERAEQYYDVKTTVFNVLIDTIDLTQLSKLNPEEAKEEIREIVSEILAIRNVVMSIPEQDELVRDICNDVLGYGPLEPLLARDEISDIMVNGCDRTYIEVKGKVQNSNVRFADNGQLMNICQRI